MSVCPVCKYNHLEDVENCQRCNWSMQDDLEVSSEHPILKTCIFTLVSNLNKERMEKENLHSLIQISSSDNLKANSQKLDELLDEVESNKKQTEKQFNRLNKAICGLKSLLEMSNGSSDITPKEKISLIENISSSVAEERGSSKQDDCVDKQYVETSFSSQKDLIESDRSIRNILDATIDEQKSDVFIVTNDFANNNDFDLVTDYQSNDFYNQKSDRHRDRNFELINEPSQAGLYDNQSDRKSSATVNHQDNNQSKDSSNSNYQSFYGLIKRGKIESIEVKVPQETVEQMRSGTQSELKFSNARKGNYWIINWQDTYYLIPKEKTYINPHQYGNFQRVFNCQNYQENYKTFEVTEPAIVINYDGDNWRLERKGKIKFI